jgi:hypothetical protein
MNEWYRDFMRRKENTSPAEAATQTLGAIFIE